MAVNEYLIEQVLDYYERKATIVPFLIEITTPYFQFSVDNDTLILSNEELDVPITAKIIINADNAALLTSKAQFEQWSEYKNQIFTNNIVVETENYGVSFVPYQLSFMRISPLPEKKNCKQPTKKC